MILGLVEQYPKSKQRGGHRSVENALLAHRLLDEELNARGILHSGIRVQRRARVIERYVNELEDDWRMTIRRIEDSGTFVGWPEKLYFKWRQKDTESQLIQGARELAEEQRDEQRKRLTDVGSEAGD